MKKILNYSVKGNNDSIWALFNNNKLYSIYFRKSFITFTPAVYQVRDKSKHLDKYKNVMVCIRLKKIRGDIGIINKEFTKGYYKLIVKVEKK